MKSRPVLPLAIAVLVASAPAPTPTPSTNPCAGLLAQLNRPTIGYSPCPVDRGSAVFELGYQNTQYGSGSAAASQMQIGQGFLRFGVARDFELDFIGPSENVARGPSGSAYGFSDGGLGLKYGILQSPRWQLGADVLYTAPNGARAFTAGSATLVANVDAGYQITPATSLGSTLSFGSSGGFTKTGMQERYGIFEPSVLVLQQFDARTQAYVEYVNVSRSAPDAGGDAFLDAGIQHLLSDDLEIDVEYGHAIAGLPSRRFTYVGAGVGVLLR